MGKIIFIAYFLIILLVIGVIVYFVGGISQQSAPIQKYEYQGTIDELILDINKYTKIKTDARYLITDTIGDIHDDYAIRLTIEMKANNNLIEYGLKIEPQEKLVKPIMTNVYLTKAYNVTMISGGYQAQSAGVKPLVDLFNSDFLSIIKKLHKVN